MSKTIALLLLAIAAGSAGNAGAEIYKCQGANGKIQFSDRACRAGSTATIVPDRAPLSVQQQEEARQKAQQRQDEALAGRAAAGAATAAQTDDRSGAAQQASGSGGEQSSDAEAAARCVRDIERHGAPQNDKAEMIAACRTAGRVQRTTGIAGDAVDDCVRSVERSGASERVKVRQLALCHGGDVEPRVVDRQRPLGTNAAR